MAIEGMPRVKPWQVAGATIAIAVLWVLAASQVAELRAGAPLLREFMAFYTVGHILNQSPAELYDPDSFVRTYHALFPGVPAHVRQVYGHAPFEAVFYRPFALLSFEWALVAWQMFSVAMICAGFTLVWRLSGSLPRSQLLLALLFALSFQPVAVETIARGQVSALAFFWIALAIWFLRRGREYWSGAALAMCLSKPTFLVLLLPMLMVGWRVRALLGFLGGAGFLGAVSLLVVGWRGCLDYVGVLLHFGGLATTAGKSFVLSEYVDLNSFLRMATGGRGRLALGVLSLVAVGVAPYLVKLWWDTRRGGDVELSLAWASTLTWTTVLNLYVTAYDTPIILLGLLLTADGLYRMDRGSIPWVLKTLFVLLYIVPWIPPVPIGDGKALQLYTVALGGLGVYQLRVALRGAGGPDTVDGMQRQRLGAKALGSVNAT